ncbi:MAG: hypothetical protein QXI39_00160 [Candidatus Bathyarchaeia archaeon]
MNEPYQTKPSHAMPLATALSSLSDGWMTAVWGGSQPRGCEAKLGYDKRRDGRTYIDKHSIA